MSTSSRPLSRPLRAVAGLLALGLTAVACGGSDDDTAVDTAAPVTSPAPDATAAITDDTPADATDATTAPADAPDDTTAPTSSDAPAPSEPVAVPAALQFTAPLVGGGEFDGATVADKPTLFWFWAPT